MGFDKVTYLYCDGDSEQCETSDKEACSAEMGVCTIATYRKAMVGSGWLFKKGNKAYCPSCRKALK